MTRPALAALAILTLLWPAAGAGAADDADEIAFAASELWIESGGERHRFRVELAETPAQQTRGLMFRTHVAPDSGMLFVYGAARHAAMWMKNTLVPLDMLFITEGGAVARIARWTTPLSLETIPSRAPVVAVLELAGGTADRLGLAAGDRVLHPTLATAPEADETP